jgi:hypothetical protein
MQNGGVPKGKIVSSINVSKYFFLLYRKVLNILYIRSYFIFPKSWALYQDSITP